MAYASEDDVTRLIAQFSIGAATKPSTTQTDSIITDIAYEIDVALQGRGISTPVTAPDYFLNWLGLVNSYGAAAAVLKSMFPAQTGPNETPAYAFWESRYKAAMKGINDGSLIPDGVSSGGRILPQTYLTNNPNKELYLGDIAEPFFKRDKAF